MLLKTFPSVANQAAIVTNHKGSVFIVQKHDYFEWVHSTSDTILESFKARHYEDLKKRDCSNFCVILSNKDGRTVSFPLFSKIHKEYVTSELKNDPDIHVQIGYSCDKPTVSIFVEFQKSGEKYLAFEKQNETCYPIAFLHLEQIEKLFPSNIHFMSDPPPISISIDEMIDTMNELYR